MRVLVVNCSTRRRRPFYNLGAHKLADWLRSQEHTVTLWDGDPGFFAQGYDLVCLSVIFSWHAPIAREIALRVRPHSEVWCGGPGMFALGTWWQRETGLSLQRGLDQRFERQRGDYQLTFASRGCPVNCSFCLVPRQEGTTFTLDADFQPAPVLGDNNLSALPVAFQEHIIQRYQETGMVLQDANSGFEPQTFDTACYHRWKPILRAPSPWRFAFDEQGEAAAVQRMAQILRRESRSRKRVYILVGNEPIASCYARAMQVIDWGCEPYCQYLLPLNWLGDPRTLRPRHDWGETGAMAYRRGRDFCRYFNRYLWKSVALHAYTNRKNEPPPFAHVHL